MMLFQQNTHKSGTAQERTEGSIRTHVELFHTQKKGTYTIVWPICKNWMAFSTLVLIKQI